MDDVLPINPSANVYHKDRQTYSGGTDRPGELCYDFSVSTGLTQMVNFPTWIPECDFHSPNFLDLSLSSTMAFPPLENSEHVVSVFIDFPTNSKRDAPFHCIAYDYSGADWDGFCDHLRAVPWEDSFKLSTSAASEFCELPLVGIDVYISCHKYQVKPHFFHLYQQNKFSESKVKLAG